MLNWWPQAGRQPIEQPCGDVHLILEPPVVIDLDGLVEDRLDALAQPCAGIVVLGPDRQDDRHEFGRLQVGCLALAEGGEDMVLEGTPKSRMDEHAVERHARGVLLRTGRCD